MSSIKCEYCNVYYVKESDYQKHITTDKHIKKVEDTNNRKKVAPQIQASAPAVSAPAPVIASESKPASTGANKFFSEHMKTHIKSPTLTYIETPAYRKKPCCGGAV